MPAIKQELTDLATKFRDHADKVDGNKRARVTSEGKCSRWSYMLAHELKPHGYVTHVVDGYYTSADEKYWETHPNVEGHGEGKSAHTWVEATKDGQTFLIDVTADQFHWDNVEQYRAVVARKDHQAYEAVQKVEASTCTAALNNDAFMLQVLNAANLTGHAFKKVSQSGKKQGYRIAPIQSTINDQAYIRIGANITSVTKSGKRGVEIRFAGITDAKVVSAKGWVTSVLKGKAHAGDAWQKLHAECEKLSQENQFRASGDRVGGLTGEDAAAVGKHLDNWLVSTTASQRKAQNRIPEIASEVEKLLKEKVATTVVAARDMYWHGTSGRHLRSILKDGLRPARKDSELVYLDETVPQDVHRSIKTYGGVYLTTNFMTAYSAGGRANKHSGESSLIIGVTYESRTDTALIDEDGVSQCIMHALGTGTFDELCRSQTVDAHRLYDLRSYYIPGTIHPKDYQAVLDEVHALDFEKAGEILIESLTKYHPGVANDYTHRKARVDAAIVDVFVATLCHLMEVNWTANKKYIRRYFEKNESSWDTLPEEERTKYTKQYKGYYATLDNPPSDMRNTHGRMADAVTKLTKLLPGLNEPSDDSPFGNSLRSAVPLKFSGKNRIVVVAEIATPDKENRQYTDIILHYGANNASVVHQLRTLYRERIGDTFRMMDAQGNVLHTSLDISAEWPEHLWGPQEKTTASLFNGQDLRTARKVKPVSSDQLRRTLVNHLKRTVYTREWYDKYNEYVSEEDGGPSFTKWQDWKIEDGWKLRASGHEGWRASLWTGDLSSFLGLEHRRNLTRSQDHSAYVDALDELMRRVGWFVQRDMRDAPPSIGGHGHKFILEPLYGERRDVPRYVYHFSAVENKDKILRNGLKPRAQSGHGGHNYPARVYLLSTFDEEHVRELAYWIANSGMSPEDFYAGRGNEPSIVVFKIDTTKLDKGTKYYDDQDVSRDAVWTYSKIPPQAIVDVVYEDTGHDEQRAANVAGSEWTTTAVRNELEKIARRKYLEFRDHYSQKAPGTPVNVCMRGECFPTTYKLAAELSEHYGYDTWQAVGWYRWKGKKPKSDGSTVRSMHWWVEARKNGHTFWVDLTAIQFYPGTDPNKPPPLVLDLGTAPYSRKRLDRPLHPSDFDDDGSDVEARVGTKTAALFNEQDLRETAKQRRKEWQDKSVGAKVAHVAKSIVRTMARPVESEKPGVYRLGAHYISPEGRYTADDPFTGMSHKMWTAFRQFVEHLTWWMGNANGYHIEEMVRVWKRSKDLRKWFAAHVNLQSYPALYHGMRLSPTDNVSVGDPVPGRSAVKQWSTKRRVAEWFAGIDTVNVPEWDGGALVGGYATGSQIIVDVDRLSALCGQHLESFSSLMRKGDPVAMFSGESYEGEVLTTPNVQGTVIRVERFHEAKPEHVYAQSSTPFHGDMSIHEAGLLIAEYYSLKPGMKIKEILSRWVENGDKAYDSPKAGFWVPVEELWPYREYMWTRANARDGSSPDPDNPGEYIDHDSGAEKWDAFVVYMKDHGWDPKEPLHFYCGKNGYGKVGEGNHRLAVARMLGLTKVPVSFHFWQKVRSDGRTLPPSVRKPGSGDYADQAEDRLRLMLQQKRERNAGGTSIGSIVKAVSKILGIEGASRSRGTVGLNTQYESQTAAEFVAGHAWNVTRCEFYVVVAEWKKKGGKRVFTWTDFYGGTKEFTTTKQARAFAKKYMNVCEDKRGKHEVTMPAPPEQYTATSTR